MSNSFTPTTEQSIEPTTEQSIESTIEPTTEQNEWCRRVNTASEWPTNSGCLDKEEIHTIKEGTIIDRFGQMTGQYFSTPKFNFSERSMSEFQNYKKCESNYTNWANENYKKFRVLRPFNVMSCKVAPAFGFIGGAQQYKLYAGSILEKTKLVNNIKHVTLQDLIEKRYIEDITKTDKKIPIFGSVNYTEPTEEQKTFLLEKNKVAEEFKDVTQTLDKLKKPKPDSFLQKMTHYNTQKKEELKKTEEELKIKTEEELKKTEEELKQLIKKEQKFFDETQRQNMVETQRQNMVPNNLKMTNQDQALDPAPKAEPSRGYPERTTNRTTKRGGHKKIVKTSRKPRTSKTSRNPRTSRNLRTSRKSKTSKKSKTSRTSKNPRKNQRTQKN